MKPSTMLATLLPSLALACPVKTAAAQEPDIPVGGIGPIILDPAEIEHILIDNVPGNLKRSRDPPVEVVMLNDLLTCLRDHKDFQADFSQANDGVFSISKVEPTCCQKYKDLYSRLPTGQYGKAAFDEPCEGAIVTGVNQKYMNELRTLFEIIQGHVDEEK